MYSPPWWLMVLMPVLLTEVAVLATSVYLHRGLAHDSLVFRRWVDVGFRGILWMLTGQNRREWVAVHRKHHTFTDREGDPHSPRLLGFWKVQLFNVYYYIVAARDRAMVEKFTQDIRDDKWDRLFFHTTAGPALGLLLLFFLFGWWGIAMGLLHGVLYVFVVAPLINGLTHWSGQQNFTNNTAYNRPLLSWVTGGESLHNNHHANPKKAKFSVRRREFDPSWPVIQVLRYMKLAWL